MMLDMYGNTLRFDSVLLRKFVPINLRLTKKIFIHRRRNESFNHRLEQKKPTNIAINIDHVQIINAGSVYVYNSSMPKKCTETIFNNTKLMFSVSHTSIVNRIRLFRTYISSYRGAGND